jgi:hypothetical protein
VERKTEVLPVAIHTRMGRDQSKEEDDFDGEEVDEEGFFSPTVLEGTLLPGVPHYNCRQWSCFAKTSPPSESLGNYTVKLYMIPNGWEETSDGLDDLLDFMGCDDEDLLECGIPFYLTTEIVLPGGRRVLDIAFYGDDGKSNLASAVDTEPGRERRQALGLLLSGEQMVESQEKPMELWVVPYDNLIYQAIAAKKDSKQIFLDDSNIHSDCRVYAKARGSNDNDELQDGAVLAKSKLASTETSFFLCISNPELPFFLCSTTCRLYSINSVYLQQFHSACDEWFARYWRCHCNTTGCHYV